MKSLFASLIASLGQFFSQATSAILTSLHQARYFLAALVLSIISPIKVGVGFLSHSLQTMDYWLTYLVNTVATFSAGNDANALWAGGGAIAGQLNAVVPLDYCFTCGLQIFSVWSTIMTIKAIIFVYELIPFKAT